MWSRKMMNKKTREYVEKLATKKVAADDEGFFLPDYCGDNLDDAFSIGVELGETALARKILEMDNESL
jgi:hypothetical protein